MLGKYKHGKITTTIDFKTFDYAMKHGEFKKHRHKSFLAFLYWLGVRVSEALERTKEDFKLVDNILIIDAPAKKGGKRLPLEIDSDLPYVDLIVEQWKKTRKGRRLWTFDPRTARRIVKRAMGEKYYPHFFRLNRVVHFLDDPKSTIPEMQAWFGWRSVKAIESYMGFSHRHIETQRRRLRREIE